MNVSGPRLALAEALGDIGTLTAYAGWNDRVIPPAVVVVPGSPWLAQGLAFGEAILTVSVLLVSGPLDRPDALNVLETLLADVLAAGDQAGWGLGGVGEPSTVTVNGAEILGTAITFTRPVRA